MLLATGAKSQSQRGYKVISGARGGARERRPCEVRAARARSGGHERMTQAQGFDACVGRVDP